MANVNLIERPTTVNFRVYNYGFYVQDAEMSLDPADSPVYFVFNSDVYATSGAPAMAYLFPNYTNANIPITVAVGDTITIYDQVFTASNNPGFNEFFAGTTADQNLIVESLADAINQNNSLNWRLTAQAITSGLPQVVLVSKYIGSNFNLILSSSFANNPTVIRSNFDSNNLNRGQELEGYDYKVFIEIWQKNPNVSLGSQDFTSDDRLLVTLSQAWNNSNRFVFDISAYLKSMITPLELRTTVYDNGVKLVNGLIGSYYIKYGEEFVGGYNKSTGKPSDPVNNITNTYPRKIYIGQTNVRWTANGVFPLNYNPSDNTQYWRQFLLNSLNNDQYLEIDILSTQPNYKLRRRTIDTELVFIVLYNDKKYSSDRNYRIYSTYTFNDGTTIGNQYTHVSNNVNESGVFVIDMAWNKLNIDTVESAYGLRVISSNHRIQVFRNSSWHNVSKSINYQYDLNTEPSNYLTFYWENSFGVIDQFTFEGTEIANVDISPTDYQRSLIDKRGNYRNEAQLRTLNKKLVDRISYSTGWIDKDHMNWLKDLLISNRVWIKEANDYVAIKITDNNWQVDRDADLYNLDITYELAIENNTKFQ